MSPAGPVHTVQGQRAAGIAFEKKGFIEGQKSRVTHGELYYPVHFFNMDYETTPNLEIPMVFCSDGVVFF